jgi:xanthine/uracil permease
MEAVSRIKKPANLVYGVEDRPPLIVTLLLGLQQLSLWSVSLVFAVIVARSIGIPPDGITSFISLSIPVMGASMLFGVSFMILSGLQIITSRMIDARKTFVIGISISIGLSTVMVPGLYDGVPTWLQTNNLIPTDFWKISRRAFSFPAFWLAG